MAKKKTNALAASDVIRKKIPYVRTFEEEGIIETRNNQYSKSTSSVVYAISRNNGFCK